MANVWFCKEGPRPNSGDPPYQMPIEECVRLLGLEKESFVGGLDGPTPKFNVNSPIGEIAGYKHVVIEVPKGEATSDWQAGYYYLPMSPTEVIERIGKDPAPLAKPVI